FVEISDSQVVKLLLTCIIRGAKRFADLLGLQVVYQVSNLMSQSQERVPSCFEDCYEKFNLPIFFPVREEPVVVTRSTSPYWRRDRRERALPRREWIMSYWGSTLRPAPSKQRKRKAARGSRKWISDSQTRCD